MTRSPATPLPPPKERRRLREAAALTRDQLAAKVGVTGQTLRTWESGRSTPRGRKGEAYARLLRSLAPDPEVTDPQRPDETGRTGTTAPDESATEDSASHTAAEDDASRTEAMDTASQAAAEDRGAPSAGTGSHDPGDHGDRPQDSPAPSLPQPREDAHSLTPAQAFDALYSFCAPALVRQTYLLTGRRELARESVEQAFRLAWERWPEVARDRDPAGWVRAAAYDCALSPWHRFRPRYRHPEPPPPDASDRALMDVLLKLPPSYRRTLVLYDGVGLDLPETAAETEASTPATASRLLHAREAVAARLPELADPEVLHWRLVELASTGRLRAARPTAVRLGCERRARFWTHAALAFTVTLIGTTALTVRTAPTRYEPPVPAGRTVQDVPPRVAPGPLSERERELRAKLRRAVADGPGRLAPEAR